MRVPNNPPYPNYPPPLLTPEMRTALRDVLGVRACAIPVSHGGVTYLVHLVNDPARMLASDPPQPYLTCMQIHRQDADGRFHRCADTDAAILDVVSKARLRYLSVQLGR